MDTVQEVKIYCDCMGEIKARMTIVLGFPGTDRSTGSEVTDTEFVKVEASSSLKLILSDIVMPRITGPKLARRACRVRSDVHLLFMTGGFHDVSVRKTDRILKKPLDFDELGNEVRRVLQDNPQPAADSAWKGPERRRDWPIGLEASAGA